MKKTIQEVIENLKQENQEKTTKKDKIQVNNYLLMALNNIADKSILLSFEQTNTNRKNSKMNGCLHFNSGVLFEIIVNIFNDMAKNQVKREYAKANAKVVDCIYNGANVEIKLSSKYAYGTKKDNKIQRNLIATINDNGAEIRLIKTNEIKWVEILETQKDGTKKPIKKVDKYQYNGEVQTNLMRMLGWC